MILSSYAYQKYVDLGFTFNCQNYNIISSLHTILLSTIADTLYKIKTILLRHCDNLRRKIDDNYKKYSMFLAILRARDFILLYYVTAIIQLAISAYGNEISITIDAMKTTLIAKNTVEVCAKRSLCRSWKAVQRELLNCFLRHPPAPEVVPTSI